MNDRRRRGPGTGTLLVVVAASLWGTTGTARALGPEGADPIAVGSVRLAVGGTLLLGAAAVGAARTGPGRRAARGRGASPEAVRGTRPRRTGWPPGPLATAILAMAAYQPLFFAGVSRAGVAVGTVVGIGTSPMAGGLLARWVRHERLGRRWYAATAVGLAGAALLAVAGGDTAGEGAGAGADGSGAGQVALGLALAVGAGVAYAVYVAASATLLDRHDPGRVAAVVLGGAGLLLVPVAVVVGVGWLAEPGGVAAAAWLGVVTVALAYPLLTRGLDRVGVGATATLTLAEPAVAAALGLIVLGERLRPLGWLGLALVGVGVVSEAAGRRAVDPAAGAWGPSGAGG